VVDVKKQLLKSAAMVSSLTFLSRVLGFVRDVIFAQLLGASLGFDAFVVASKIPNFMRCLFAEGAFSQAFVPVLSAYREHQTESESRLFMQRVLGLLTVVLLGVTVLGFYAAPTWVCLFAPGMADDPERLRITAHLLMITFPYLLFISWVAFAGAVMTCHGRFAVMSVTPLILNIVLILAACYGTHWVTPRVEALAMGLVLAGFVQWLFQLPFLKRLGVSFWPKLTLRDPGVRRVMRLMLPGLFGVSVAQISMMIDTWFASYLPVGSISWLYYSDRLTYFPLGIFGYAIATVILPNLSKHHAKADRAQFHASLDWGLRGVLLFGVPAAVGLNLLAGPIIATLFYHGSFTEHDVLMSRLSLMAYVLGLPGFMVIKVVASGFYARENMSTPVRLAAIALLVNIGLNILLVGSMAHAGLALATAVAATLNAGMLFYYLVKKEIFQPLADWWFYIGKLSVACLVTGLWLFWQRGDMSDWLHWSQWLRLSHLGLLIVGAISLYMGSLWLMGVRTRDFYAEMT